MVTHTYLEKIRDTMVSRGPDGAGAWIAEDGRVGLAHQRLSIIDLSSSADQPMANDDGSIQLVFNGEIYNHAEIRAELESLGRHRWKTDHSDTEVILRAFEEWGIECLHRFRGMFAIALWDARKGELWLLRDRFGVKPLYYSVHHGRLVFASEIKALLEDPQQPRAVNEEGLFHYLSFLTVPAPDTMFEGIHKVPAGTWIHCDRDGRLTSHRYYDVLDHVRSVAGQLEEEVATELLSEIRTAVQYRKVSDVPVGIFLSGGVDSSTNAALFSEGESSAVNTFSIGYEGTFSRYTNEFEHARSVGEYVGANHHERALTQQDFIDFLPRMIHLQDEPLADPVCVPVYYLADLARRHGVIVCQVGEGADELFFGYPGWLRVWQLHRLDRLPVPRFAKRLAAWVLRCVGFGDNFYYEYLRRANRREPVFWSGSEGFGHLQKVALLSERLRRKFDGRTSYEVVKPVWERYRELHPTGDFVNWMAYMDLNLRLPELLLMRVDKMTMGVSLEARVPFLDHKVAELALGIPPRLKYRDGRLKWILKAAVRGLIPDSTIDRKKQGFAAPIEDWYGDALGHEAVRDLKEFCESTDYLDAEAVEALLASGMSEVTWPLVNLARWWRHFIKDGAASEALSKVAS